MKLADIIAIVNDLAPRKLALPGDPGGLQIGNGCSEVYTAAVVLDPTPNTLRQARDKQAQVVFGHHPIIYNPITSLDESDPHASLIAEFIRSNIAYFAIHTNWDIAEGGLNDALANALGILEAVPLDITRTEQKHKLVTFVPEEAVEKVRKAIGDAGGGTIGHYTHCSFRSKGTGAFLPGQSASPHIGSHGRLEEVQEWRIEVILDDDQVTEVVQAMSEAHPYEEVAYDLYPLDNPGKTWGIGRVGRLSARVTFKEFQSTAARALGNPIVRNYGDDNRLIGKVAVCGGSGGSLVGKAASLGADCYVTADLRHHEIIQAQSLGLCIIDGTHQATEALGMKHFANRLSQALAGRVKIEFVDQD